MELRNPKMTRDVILVGKYKRFWSIAEGKEG